MSHRLARPPARDKATETHIGAQTLTLCVNIYPDACHAPEHPPTRAATFHLTPTPRPSQLVRGMG